MKFGLKWPSAFRGHVVRTFERADRHTTTDNDDKDDVQLPTL